MAVRAVVRSSEHLAPGTSFSKRRILSTSAPASHRATVVVATPADVLGGAVLLSPSPAEEVKRCSAQKPQPQILGDAWCPDIHQPD